MRKVSFIFALLAILTSNLVFIQPVKAESQYYNCTSHDIPSPSTETPTHLCQRLWPDLPILKYSAPLSECVGYGQEEACCCQTKDVYECSWKAKVRSQECIGTQCTTIYTGGCSDTEKGGTDCNASSKPVATSDTQYVCCCPSEVVSTDYVKADFVIPELQVKIDSVSLSEAKCSDEESNCEIPWIAEYIKGVYDYGLGIGGILAAIVLMAGGVLWLVSAGDASKITQAKDLIVGSITGMLILVGTYFLLVQINPELTYMKAISLKMIERTALEPGNEVSEDTTSPFFQCANQTYGDSPEAVRRNLTTVNFLGMNYEVNKQMAVILVATQKQIDQAGITYKSTEAAGGGFNWRNNVNDSRQRSLHSYGIALDINPAKNPNYKSTKRPCRTDMPADLIKIMKEHGFRWGGDYKSVCDSMHFEWVKDNAPCKIN